MSDMDVTTILGWSTSFSYTEQYGLCLATTYDL
jgi:hypothetical protein